MQAFRITVTVILTFSSSLVRAQSNSDSIQKLESSGDTLGARTALARAAEANPSNVAALTDEKVTRLELQPRLVSLSEVHLIEFTEIEGAPWMARWTESVDRSYRDVLSGGE